MPKYNNSFREPEHEEHMIQDEKGELIGTIRIKPSSIKFYFVEGCFAAKV